MLVWPIYEGDGLIHDPPQAAHSGKPSAADVAGTAVDTAAAAPVPPVVAERRAEAMRRFFPKLSAWLAHQIHMAHMREVHHYLSQATDIFDLERRIRHIERGAAPY